MVSMAPKKIIQPRSNISYNSLLLYDRRPLTDIMIIWAYEIIVKNGWRKSIGKSNALWPNTCGRRKTKVTLSVAVMCASVNIDLNTLYDLPVVGSWKTRLKPMSASLWSSRSFVAADNFIPARLSIIFRCKKIKIACILSLKSTDGKTSSSWPGLRIKKRSQITGSKHLLFGLKPNLMDTWDDYGSYQKTHYKRYMRRLCIISEDVLQTLHGAIMYQFKDVS